MTKLKRLTYAKEPVLHVHRYIVEILTVTEQENNSTFKYVDTYAEVKKLKESLDDGQKMHVYTADHNYKCGWYK